MPHTVSLQVIRRPPPDRPKLGGDSKSIADLAQLSPAINKADALKKPLVNRRLTMLVSQLVLACALAAIVKAVLLPFPVSNVSQLARWILRLSIVVSADWCFLAGMTMVAAAAAVLTPRGKTASAAWTGLVLAAYAAVALYHVVSIPMYRVMMVPFSIRLISFIGGPGMMASSLAPFLPSGTIAALCAAPLSVLSTPWIAARMRDRCRVIAVRPALVGLCVALAAYAAIAQAYIKASWNDPNRWERRIAHSAHAVLLKSCLEELVKERTFTNTFDVGATDTTDFQPTAVRTAGAQAGGLPILRGPRPKNIVWVVMESVSAEYLSLYGARHDTTPNLVRLASEGMVFDQLYAQAGSSCKSLVCLSASVYPRPDWLLITRDFPRFSVPTIAETLKTNGFRTCYAHSGYWSWNRRDEFLSRRGVDKLIDGSDRPGQQAFGWGIHDEVMYGDVLAWIDETPGKPFFAFAYTIETHHPYKSPREPRNFDVKNPEFERYLNAIRAADEKIGWLVEELRKRNLLDSTLVVITSDHGESFGRHGQRFHNFCVYDEGVRVPLLMLHPSLKSSGRSAILAQHIDLAPTMLHMLGIPQPGQWQGQSLFAQARLPRAYFCSVGNQVVVGLREGNLKYHYYVDDRREELFDLASDPLEATNLADSEPQRCAQYRAKVAGLVEHQRTFLARHGVGSAD